MLIVADENMPQVREAFAALGEVRTVRGRDLDAAAVADADILLVRSVTRVDRELIEGSRVRFVGTATIGTDHLDLDYLRARGIAVASAPGSNAAAVVDYVLAALAALDDTLERLLGGARVGIIGLGNVGARLLRRLSALGANCVGYDPLPGLAGDMPLVALETALDADIVCCHAPLTRGGAFPSFHLLDERRLQRLRRGGVLLNAGRGAVIDGRALKDLLEVRTDMRAVLDVWEGEPDIDRALLRRVALGTPHIAGYSLDGKIAGTRMMLDACCAFLHRPPLTLPDVVPMALELPPQLSGAPLLRAAMHAVYDPRTDDAALRAAMQVQDKGGEGFDLLRKNYRQRREFSACRIVNWRDLRAPDRELLIRAGFDGGV